MQHEGKAVQPVTDARNQQKQDSYRQVLDQLLALDCKCEEAVQQFFSSMSIEE